MSLTAALLSLAAPVLAYSPAAEDDKNQPSKTQDPSVAVENTVEEALQDFTNPNWWVKEFTPTAIRIVVIIVVALVLRYLMIKAVEKLVAQRVASQRRTAEGLATAESARVESVIEAQRQAQRAQTLGSLFRNLITLVVYSFAALLVLSELGFNLGPLIAGAGIAGVAIGFGAQSLVADFLSGIFILMEDQYGVGDVVDVGDANGVVEEVQLRITKIRGIDGVLWFVRNGEIVRVGNKSQDWSRTVLDINVGYNSDLQQAKEILIRVGEDLARDKDYGDKVLETPELWGVEDLTPDGVMLRMVVKTKPGEQWTASRVLRERIKTALEEEGIEIPFPQRTIWVRHEESPLLSPPIPAKKQDQAREQERAKREQEQQQAKQAQASKVVEGDDPKAFMDDPSGFEDENQDDDTGFGEDDGGDGDGDGDGDR
jgi:small conductance mechanosensitive channel